MQVFKKGDDGAYYAHEKKYRLVPRSLKEYYKRGYDLFRWHRGKYEFVKLCSTQLLAKELIDQMEAEK